MSDARDSFLVEDFMESITAQLDRTQDALAVKAVNRPLTYAVKEFSLDLRVFVDMDRNGNIRMRPSGPDDAGASTVQIGFTTITRPMIEENTISTTASRSPLLDEVGLEEGERRRLERLGVRNVDQLERLRASTGSGGISRLAGVTADRLRAALRAARPEVRRVEATPMPRDHEPPTHSGPREAAPTPRATPPIRLRPGDRRLRLDGRNLLGPKGPPKVTLGSMTLEPSSTDDDHIILDIPAGAASGQLTIELGDGERLEYELEVPPPAAHVDAITPEGDTWVPNGGHTT